MKLRALDYLACPACAGDLQLEEKSREGEDVMTGSLCCTACSIVYPIEHGVPRFAGDIGALERHRHGFLVQTV